MKHSIVVKSNKVIEASYRLTLNEQRLVLACIQQIKPKQSITEASRFTVSALEFAKLYDISSDRAYDELQTVAERLYERSVTINDPDPDDPSIAYTKTRWITSIGYKPKQGQIVLRFSHRMIPYIAMLHSHFTQYDLAAVANMRSTYGVRFYELFKCWTYGNLSGQKEIAVTELKGLLELDNQYTAIKDFKKYVVDLAIQDINEHSDMTASYTQRKQGRVVSHFTFQFGFKSGQVPSAAKAKRKRITKAEIEKAARPGESYEEVKARLEEQLKLAI